MTPLIVESWIWWSCVMLVAFSRFVSRRMTLGSFRKYQVDDYLMILALCFYTTLISTINIVRHTNSNLLPPGFNVHTLTKQEIQDREYGSKLILVVEQSQCATVWLVKACLVLLYLRLTSVHKENIAIKILLGYVIVTFVVMDILYFGVWCQPFHEYWAVPTDSRQCDAATNHLITNACFNLSSDVAMLLIVLPIFVRMKLPWRRKIPIILLFSLGIFTILAAILNKVYSFSDPYGSLWTYWYTRESSTALLVANLPFVWTLWLRIPGVRTVVGRSQTAASNYDMHSIPARPVDNKLDGAKAVEESLTRSSDETRGKESVEGGMTFTDILAERNPASMVERPNPITHPSMFYARKKSSHAHWFDLEAEGELSEEPITRPDSNPNDDDRPASAFASSPVASKCSQKSTGSFV